MRKSCTHFKHADIFIIFDIFWFAIIMTKHDYQLFGYFSIECI